MTYKLLDGKTLVSESDFKHLRQVRGWDYMIQEFFHVSYVDVDGMWWADLDSIQPSELRDMIKSDFQTLIEG